MKKSQKSLGLIFKNRIQGGKLSPIKKHSKELPEIAAMQGNKPFTNESYLGKYDEEEMAKLTKQYTISRAFYSTPFAFIALYIICAT